MDRERLVVVVVVDRSEDWPRRGREGFIRDAVAAAGGIVVVSRGGVHLVQQSTYFARMGRIIGTEDLPSKLELAHSIMLCRHSSTCEVRHSGLPRAYATCSLTRPSSRSEMPVAGSVVRCVLQTAVCSLPASLHRSRSDSAHQSSQTGTRNQRAEEDVLLLASADMTGIGARAAHADGRPFFLPSFLSFVIPASSRWRVNSVPAGVGTSQ